jgi:deoxyhypusine synthase
VPNKNYVLLEEWFASLVQELHVEQHEKGTIFSPSQIINRMGKSINNEESVYYWCWKNNIPVFCPAFTDGALGDVLFFESFNEKGFIVDLVQDTRKINGLSLKAKKSGMIILGGGVAKHHVCNAN